MSKEFIIGSTVRVVALPPYVKTAEPMPMLRPPDLIHLGEEGTGAFLLDSQYIESTDNPPESQIESNSDQEL
jgi:Protein of unknown function (DUF3148)